VLEETGFSDVAHGGHIQTCVQKPDRIDFLLLTVHQAPFTRQTRQRGSPESLKGNRGVSLRMRSSVHRDADMARSHRQLAGVLPLGRTHAGPAHTVRSDEVRKAIG
jgi:hypothetical protein